MMFESITRSVPRKIMVVVLATTGIALLLSATMILVYDVNTFQHSWVHDLGTQADILALSSAPALAFDDRQAASENLAALRARAPILEAAIYTPDGKLFAGYTRPGTTKPLPALLPPGEGYQVEGDQIVLAHRVVKNGETLGTIYLLARYQLRERLQDYLGILAVVMIASLAVALLVASWLQASVTRPIATMAGVARRIVDEHDYSLRATRTTQDEIGLLVDAFNDMLDEVGRHAAALEDSNRTLQHEMKVRLAAEATLRASDRRKDEFLATLAHELRNPLAPIRNGLEILRRAADRPQATALAREVMERQLRQMARLVDDLLDVSRITTGRLIVKKDRAELHDIVRAAVEMVTPVVESRSHTLSVALPDAPIHLHADATRLAQVFGNLLNNAAKYTDPGGRISLSARQAGAQVSVEIVDNGLGIDAAMLPRIFDMFTQADNSIERVQFGLGVGLTLARRLVELHDGSIEAHSEGLGKGSRFVVRLPTLDEQAATSDPAVALGEDASAAAAAKRVLLADDNVDFAQSMAVLLRAAGHEVQLAFDGMQAAEMAAQFSPDIAFLDIGLPKLNGYDLARRLRGESGGRTRVLVAVTGWGQDTDRRRAREAGFDLHLVKPVEPERMLTLLRTSRPCDVS